MNFSYLQSTWIVKAEIGTKSQETHEHQGEESVTCWSRICNTIQSLKFILFWRNFKKVWRRWNGSLPDNQWRRFGFWHSYRARANPTDWPWHQSSRITCFYCIWVFHCVCCTAKEVLKGVKSQVGVFELLAKESLERRITCLVQTWEFLSSSGPLSLKSR